MKKLLFLVVFACFGFFKAQAQWFIGGSIGTKITKETKAFSFASDVGYHFSDAPLSLACEFDFNASFLKGEDAAHSLAISPYCTFDICDISERFSLSLDFITNFEALHFDFFEIGLSPGVTISINEHWEANFNFGYIGYLWEQNPDEDASHSFNLDFKPIASSFKIYYYF